MIHNSSAPVHSLDELPLILTVPEAGVVLRIGRSSTYSLVRCGKLRSLRIGNQLRIPRQAVIDYMLSTE